MSADKPIHYATSLHHFTRSACGIDVGENSTTSEDAVTCGRCLRILSSKAWVRAHNRRVSS